MKTKFTAQDIREGRFSLSPTLSARVTVERDDDHGAPWEENDGHGPVSEWTARDKRPGERVLSADRHVKRFYDFAAAVEIAKRDGWDAPPYKTGTKGEQAARAVESDFQFLKSWCDDEWFYAVVSVTLHDVDGEEIATDCLGGVESKGDYWRECAADMLNELIAQHGAETVERAYWEARDTVTA